MLKHHHAPAPPDDPDMLAKLGYEERDVAMKTLLKWAGGMGVFIVGSLAVAFLVYKVFVPANADAVAANPLTNLRRTPPPNVPVLQARPREDMVDFRRAEEARVNTYGRVPGTQNGVRIPMDRAIEIINETGFPQRDVRRATGRGDTMGRSSAANVGRVGEAVPAGVSSSAGTSTSSGSAAGGGAGGL